MARIAPPADFYRADAYCAEESVGYLMKRIMMSVVYQADKRLDVHELTSAQWGPLMRLRTTGGSTVAELARWLQVDAGAMTRLLDRLEKKGLCKRVRSTEDRRVVQVELTPEGRGRDHRGARRARRGDERAPGRLFEDRMAGAEDLPAAHARDRRTSAAMPEGPDRAAASDERKSACKQRCLSK